MYEYCGEIVFVYLYGFRMLRERTGCYLKDVNYVI